MSDQSSESSGEWIVLNEDEEELELDNNEQSLNLELSYDAICNAASDSIRSSISSEELEWQYEQFENYIPPHRPPFIQDVNLPSYDTDDCESEDSNVEDDIAIKYASTSDIEEEENIIDFASVSKIHSYKHDRNDRLNFILNFALALVFASAIGLGIGHFLGWSHKCFKIASVTHKAADNIVKLPHAVAVEQKNAGVEHSKKDRNIPLLLETLNSVSCASLKSEDSPAQHDISNAFVNSDITIDSGFAESQMFRNSHVLDLKTQEDALQNNFSNPYALSVINHSDILTNIDWKELSNIEKAVKEFNSFKGPSSSTVDIDSVIEDEINNIELQLPPRKATKEDIANENDKLSFKNKFNNNEFNFLKEYFNGGEMSNSENNLTTQLRKDLNEVVQSLAAIALARLSDVNEKYSTSVEESELIMKLFSDFQTLINRRITNIDNFVSSVEYKNAPKFSLKYLRRKVYTLVDSVDYLMKISFKALNKNGEKINTHKFSNNISKVIFNFNKKWEKNDRFWFESLEKQRVNNFQEGYPRKGKENKYLKNKAQFEKQSKKKYKHRKYSMKS